MKKLISILSAAAIMLMLAVPCFAAGTAKFSINVISETDTQLSISIDYEGGSAFACYDFELKYNDKKLSVVSAIEGDGWERFAKDSKINGGAVISSINPTDNPIKGTCATTNPFVVIDGKDLALITFKKLVKEKVTSSDITLKFTNCQTVEFETLKTDIKSMLADTPVTSASSGLTDKKTENSVSQSNGTEATPSEDKNSESKDDVSADVNPDLTEKEVGEELSAAETENNSENTSNTKKIVVVAAAAICMVFVIAAVCVYLIKKSKNDGE